MAMFKSYKDVTDGFAGKLVLCRSANYGTCTGTRKMIEFKPGELLFIIGETSEKIQSYHITETKLLKVLRDNLSVNIILDQSFTNNWVILEPENVLQGDKICFTGALSYTREYYNRVVEIFGGVFQTTVSAATKYLVMQDKSSKTTKAEKARAQGVTLLNEQEFLNMIRTRNNA